MSTREALIEEILKQPEPVLREVQRYLAYLVDTHQRGTDQVPTRHTDAWPQGYFEQTAGAFSQERFERPAQLPFETREAW